MDAYRDFAGASGRRPEVPVPNRRGTGRAPAALFYDRRVTITGDLLVWNARLVDGHGGAPRERVAIDIRGGLIAEIVDLNGEGPPDGALDVTGRTVLPGLIDAHVHVMSDLERSPGFGPRTALEGRGAAPERAALVRPRQVCPRVPPGRVHDDPRRRQPRRRGDRAARGHPARAAAMGRASCRAVGSSRRRRPAAGSSGRCTRGRRALGDATSRPRAAPARRRLHQGDGDRRPVGDARIPSPPR